MGEQKMKITGIRSINQPLTKGQVLTVSIAASLLLIGIILLTQISQTAEWESGSAVASPSSANLLRNASFEEGFYWNRPNHYVAYEWNRWWIDGSHLPEYTDSSTGTTRPHFDGNRAQAWHIWGKMYTAGIYQVSSDITPCTLYNLSAWVYNSSLPDALPHAKLGLDPNGTQLTNSPSSGAIQNLPPRTIWSREQTTLNVWEQLSVMTEAIGENMTAILYTSPQKGNRDQTYFYDTSWDAASLVQIPFPDNRLPEPTNWEADGFIYNVNVTPSLNSVIIEWDTQAAASTQVWYKVTASPLITQSVSFSYTTFLPMISKPIATTSPFPLETEIDLNPVLHHQARIPDLPVQSTVTISYTVLSRYAESEGCTTKASRPDSFTFQTPHIYKNFLPIATNNRQSQATSFHAGR